MNETFEAIEDKMMEASSTEELQQVLVSSEEIVILSKMTWYLFLSELKEGNIHKSRTNSKGKLGGLLLFVHNGRECVGERQAKTIRCSRLACITKQSVLRSSMEPPWCVSNRSAEMPTGKQGYPARG